MLKKYLKKAVTGRDLTAAEMGEAFELLTSGTVPHSQIGAFLAAMQIKGITGGELAGAAAVMRRAANFIDCGQREVVDVVGTGGDGADTFNISTASCFVAAGAGVAMAKHGNRAATSRCGSADVLAELGVNLDAPAEKVEASIMENGIGFLFAARLHPVMGRMRIIRGELGIPTVFNLLGPLTNPAGAKYQVIGVFAAELTELFAAALRDLGSRHALVVHGMDGLDEISCCAPTRVSELLDGEVRTRELLPEMFFDGVYDKSELVGGDAKTNAAIMLDVLSGRDRGARRAVVLLNAGAVIYVSGLAADIAGGVELARRSIDSGAALDKLEILKEAVK
ncbi:MAG: anthranilate phosphoribosyltransferase [Victivallaceae bacterium]|nr:anthranilate phosphoribosyltransferase [Victivallaceae bacterium]